MTPRVTEVSAHRVSDDDKAMFVEHLSKYTCGFRFMIHRHDSNQLLVLVLVLILVLEGSRAMYLGGP